MNQMSFEAATNEYYRAASELGFNAPEPNAECSERVSEGWLLKTDNQEPTAIVLDNGAVLNIDSTFTPATVNRHCFKSLDARPDLAEIAIEVLIGKEGYHIEFREEVFDKLEQLGWFSTIASHLKAVLEAYGEDAKAREEAAKHEAYARHTREMLTRAKTATPPLYDDGIPF